jgi:WhiB family redox-sensing transcriptional regulator
MQLEGAACTGADPRLFDAVGGDAAEDALSYCDRCSVRQACEDLVRPAKSYFDGVAAGRIWHNGAPAQQPALFT